MDWIGLDWINGWAMTGRAGMGGEWMNAGREERRKGGYLLATSMLAIIARYGMVCLQATVHTGCWYGKRASQTCIFLPPLPVGDFGNIFMILALEYRYGHFRWLRWCL